MVLKNKRILAALMAVALMLGAMPVFAVEQDEGVFNTASVYNVESTEFQPNDAVVIDGDEADVVTLEEDKAYAILYADGTLVFQRGGELDSSHGDLVGGPWTGFEESGSWERGWKKNTGDITSVIINDPISPKKLKEWFMGCVNLVTVEGLNNVTLNGDDMGHMFRGCTSLEEISFEGIETHDAMFMDCLFYGCTNLKSVDMTGLDTENCFSFVSMFCKCSSLVFVNLSTLNTSFCADMVAMFEGCSSIEEIDMSNFDMSQLSETRTMFKGCSSLKRIVMGENFVPSGARSTVSMFEGCGSLTSIETNNFDMSNVRSASRMFFGCEGLTELDLTNWDMGKMSNTTDILTGCNNLHTIIVGEKFVTGTDREYVKRFLLPIQSSDAIPGATGLWYDADGNEYDYHEGSFNPIPDGKPGTYSAVRPKAETFTVDFYNGKQLVNTLTVEKGGKVEKPEDPTMEILEFLHWAEAETKREWDFENDTVTSDVTLTAVYKAAEITPAPTPEPTPEPTPVPPSSNSDDDSDYHKCYANAYKDVSRSKWYHDAVDWALKNKYLMGTDEKDTKWEPDADLTRAQCAAMIARRFNTNNSKHSENFGDVTGNYWAKDYIGYCFHMEYMLGYGPDLFGSEDSITREQFMTVLYRLAKDTTLGKTKTDGMDFSDVSDWAMDAMQWAASHKIITGNEKGDLMPQKEVSRAEAVQIYMRAVQQGKLIKPEKVNK